MVSSSLYKRIWKNTIKRFLFTLENQPIFPNPDVWMVQRRRSSQHRKLAKVAFKKKNLNNCWNNAFETNTRYCALCRSKVCKKPSARSHHSVMKDFSKQQDFLNRYRHTGLRRRKIEHRLQLDYCNIPQIHDSSVQCWPVLYNDITSTPSGQLHFTRRYATKMIYLQNKDRIFAFKSHQFDTR